MIPDPGKSLRAHILLKLVRRLRFAEVALASVACRHLVHCGQFARVLARLDQSWFFTQLQAPLCLELFHGSTDRFLIREVDGS